MREEILRLARQAGADDCGFGDIKLVPNAKDNSVLVVVKAYNLHQGDIPLGFTRSASANLTDYHLVLEQILGRVREQLPFPSRISIDQGEYNERDLAVSAGLGYRGKNGFLIHPEFGSATNIGLLFLDAEFEASGPIEDTCGSCRRCLEACPNQALGPFQKERCLSFQTQQKQLGFTDLRGYFYGCDICQVACPKNRIHQGLEDLLFREEDFEGLSNREFNQRYGKRDFAWIGKATLLRNMQWNKRSINMENIHELGYLKEKIEGLKKDGVYRKLPVLESASSGMVRLDGQEVINLSSNNYLGFANNERLKKASIAAIEKYGVGAGAVRTIIGNLSIHEELERKLAEFKREEAVMLYQSGFNCNAGTIQAITDKGDLIISDELNHASIIDGVRLSKADKAVFKHSDMADLERVLKETDGKYNTRLIITDGVFSMDGDIAKLPEIVDLAEKYGALTYVDDAHGSGVLGENGRGTVDHFHLHGRVDFIIGTLSKALGVIGGYVAGSKVMYEWLNHRSRPILFSTSMTPASAGALLEAVDMLMESSEYTDRLWDNARYFKEELGKLGFNTGHSETPITPVIIGEEAKTMEFSKALKAKGVFVSAIVFPTVPRGTGRLRCMVSAAHTKEELKKAVEAFAEVGKEMGII